MSMYIYVCIFKHILFANCKYDLVLPQCTYGFLRRHSKHSPYLCRHHFGTIVERSNSSLVSACNAETTTSFIIIAVEIPAKPW